MGMKRRYLAVLMGIMVATTSVPAMVYAEDSKTETAADAANDESGEADASDENGDESQENVVLGEVKSVSDSEITIAVGHILSLSTVHSCYKTVQNQSVQCSHDGFHFCRYLEGVENG